MVQLDPRWLSLLGCVLLGCGPSVVVMENGDSSSGESGEASTMSTSSSTGTTGTTSTTGTPPNPSDPATSGPSTATTSVTVSTSFGSFGSSDATGPIDDSGSTDSPNPGANPDGSPCMANAECKSNRCSVAGILGGICGECNEDADCQGGGCSPPNPLNSNPARCNDGEFGGGCETSAVCADPLLCGEVMDIPGVIQVSTCGACIDDADCGALTCQPDYDIPGLTGTLQCTMFDSLPDGRGCSLLTGDAACSSGHCALANLMGLLQLGVCSECQDDGDCTGQATCVPPEIDLDTGLRAGFCQ